MVVEDFKNMLHTSIMALGEVVHEGVVDVIDAIELVSSHTQNEDMDLMQILSCDSINNAIEEQREDNMEFEVTSENRMEIERSECALEKSAMWDETRNISMEPPCLDAEDDSENLIHRTLMCVGENVHEGVVDVIDAVHLLSSRE